MPPTADDRCDWCYGPLASSDLESPLGVALGAAEAGACAQCVTNGLPKTPPDSLHPNDVTLPGNVAWRVAVAAAMSGDIDEAAKVLRGVAGLGEPSA